MGVGGMAELSASGVAESVMSEALQITTKAGGSTKGDVVFLCHNSLDKPFIRQIADALELEFGTRFFLDVFAIPTGEAFIPWIEKALEECAVCAIFLGGNGWGPTHLWEAELALARYRRDPHLRIIPVALPGINLSEAAKLGSGKLFQDVNWADFTNGPDDKESLDKFEAALTGRSTLGYRGPARLTPYQMRRDAARWEKSGRKDHSILYGGRQLADAESVAQSNPDAVVLSEITPFLVASKERQSRFWRRMALLAGAALLVLAAASVIALTNYVLAEQRRLASVSRQLAMAAREAAGPDRALLISARGVLTADTPEANGALLEQLQDYRFLRRIVRTGNYAQAATLGLDRRFLVGTSSGPFALRLEDETPSTLLGTTPQAKIAVTAILECEEGMVLGREDGRVDIAVSGQIKTLLPAAHDVSEQRETQVRALAYDRSRRLLAVGTGSGRMAVVRLSDSRIVSDVNEGEAVRINSLSFDATRPRLAAGTSEGVIALMNIDTFNIDRRYPKIDGGVLALGYTKDGSLAAVSGGGRLYFFDRRNPELESPTTGDAVPLATAATIDAGTARVAVGESSGVVRLFDASTGSSTGAEPLRGHSDTVTAIAFGPGKDDLISVSSNGTVAIWDLAGRQGPAEELSQLNPSPSIIRVNDAGTPIVAPLDETHAEIRKLENGEWKVVMDLVATTRNAEGDKTLFAEPKQGTDGFIDVVSLIPSIALSENGERVAWSTSGGAVLASETTGSSKPIVLSPGGRSPPEDIAMSGNGKTIGVIEKGGSRVSVHEGGAAPKVTAIVPLSPARSLALTRDGASLAIGLKDGRLVRYSKAGGWTQQGDPWTVHDSEVAGVQYWPDESVIVSFGSGGGGSDRTIALSNASRNPDPRRLQARHAGGSVSSISVGKQGGLAIGDQNGEVLRWSPEARYSGRLSAGMFYISAVLVDDSNRRLLTASGDGFVRSWPLDTTRWIAMACAKANRAWEPQEWRELLPDDPYIASCTEKTPRRSWSIGN